MAVKTLRKVARRYFDQYAYMVARFPKAAKKRRIRSKWKKRFPNSLSVMFAERSPILDLLPKNEPFYGRHLPIRLDIESEK